MQIIPIDGSEGEFFKILATTDKTQIGVMTLNSGEDSGPEDIHTGDQIIYLIAGKARLVVNIETIAIKKGEAFIISTQAKHHIYNDSDETLFILTMYAPPQY